jgi:hypothetical protein
MKPTYPNGRLLLLGQGPQKMEYAGQSWHQQITIETEALVNKPGGTGRTAVPAHE